MPELAAYARTATRLHPRPGVPSAGLSHVGGPIWWPADEPWPMCRADLPGEHEKAVRQLDGTYLAVKKPPAYGARPLPHAGPNPMIVVAQLWVVDIPDLWCPPDSDLLQILWCPFDHDQDDGTTPTVSLFWRRHEPSTPVADPPTGLVDDRFYVPTSCVLHPEQITEYPQPEDLPDQLAAAVEEACEGYDYTDELSTAPGWKVGGWPDWTYNPAPTECSGCNADMRLLLSIGTVEHDGGRWQPEEEAGLPKTPEYTEPTGIIVGPWGTLHIFVCTSCPGHPFRLRL